MIFRAYLLILLVQTIQYFDCFVWGIENYSRNSSVSEVLRGIFCGWVEFADNYLILGEHIQHALILVIKIIWG